MRLFLSIAIKGLNFLKIWANGDELAQSSGLTDPILFVLTEQGNAGAMRKNLNGA